MTLRSSTVVIFSFAVINSLSVVRAADAPCPDGSWGSRCQFLCHCKNVAFCDPYSGECSDGACDSGWFDIGCQYVDWTAQSDAPSWLIDGDDTTCNPDPTNDTITITFDETQLVTRYRLVGDPSSAVATDALSTLTISINSTGTAASDRSFKHSGNMVEFFVDVPQFVAGYVFTGSGVGLICSIYVTTGRNVAVKQNATLSTQLGGSEAGSAVDGKVGQDSNVDKCAQTDAADPSPSLGIEFDNPVQIVRMIVLGVDHITYPQFQLKAFKVVGFDGNNSQVYTHDASSVTTSRHSIYVPSPTLSSLQITPSGGKELHICEFEAYGDTDCPDFKFGPECTYNCYCDKDTCGATGWCDSGCAEGYKEPYCLGCPDGFFGLPACGQACSENCIGDCEVEDGCCKGGCKSGFWGMDCFRECECSGACDQESGSCPGDALIILIGCGVGVVLFSLLAYAIFARRKKRNEGGRQEGTDEGASSAGKSKTSSSKSSGTGTSSSSGGSSSKSSSGEGTSGSV